MSFYSGVYSSCIGFTSELGESAKTLVGLSGICIGVGEVFGKCELVTLSDERNCRGICYATEQGLYLLKSFGVRQQG